MDPSRIGLFALAERRLAWAEQRQAVGRGVSALANPGAALLMLAFGATRLRNLVGGVSQDDVEAAFGGWTLISVDSAPTEGLGWPMNRTSPRWYRLRRGSRA